MGRTYAESQRKKKERSNTIRDSVAEISHPILQGPSLPPGGRLDRRAEGILTVPVRGAGRSRAKASRTSLSVFLDCRRDTWSMLSSFVHRLKGLYRSVGAEPFVWGGALLYFAFLDPSATATLSLCPLHNLGFHSCPGCGLGRSISFFLHGEVMNSVHTHLLGIPTTLVIVGRIASIVKAAHQRNACLHNLFNPRNLNGEHPAVDAHVRRR